MGGAKALGELVILLLLAAVLGYLFALFSDAGTPDRVLRGAPLQKAGSGPFIAAGLAGLAAAWRRPRFFLLWPFGIAAGFVAAVGTRVSTYAHGLSASPYLLALVLSVAVFAGAMIGAIAGALGSQLFGRADRAMRHELAAPQPPNGIVTAGKWISVCGLLTPVVLVPFAIANFDFDLALIAVLVALALFFSGIAIRVIVYILQRRDARRKVDA